MHWDQMTDTVEDLRKRATRLRRGVGQLGVLESIIDAADGPWLGAMDADGRGAAELRMHLVGRYRLTVVVTSAGKISHVQLNTPVAGAAGERVLSPKPALRKGWDEHEKMPKQPAWLDYVVEWVENASGSVGRHAIVEWRLRGADRQLAAMNDTIDTLRANLVEREAARDELAAEVADLRAELVALVEELEGVISRSRADDAAATANDAVTPETSEPEAPPAVPENLAQEAESSPTPRAAGPQPPAAEAGTPERTANADPVPLPTASGQVPPTPEPESRTTRPTPAPESRTTRPTPESEAVPAPSESERTPRSPAHVSESLPPPRTPGSRPPVREADSPERTPDAEPQSHSAEVGQAPPTPEPETTRPVFESEGTPFPPVSDHSPRTFAATAQETRAPDMTRHAPDAELASDAPAAVPPSVPELPPHAPVGDAPEHGDGSVGAGAEPGSFRL